MIRRTCGSQNTGWPPVFTLSLLIIREFGSHTIPLSKFASAILSSAYSTKAIAPVSVKCRRTRYLRLVSVLPCDRQQSALPQFGEAERGKERNAAAHGSKKRQIFHCWRLKTGLSSRDRANIIFRPVKVIFLPYLPGSGKRKQSGLYPSYYKCLPFHSEFTFTKK